MTNVFNILDNRIKELAVSRFKLDLINIMPKIHPKANSKIDKKINKNTITIKCLHKNYKGRILNPQNQPKSIIIPRFIYIDEKLGEILGLYYGDGTKNSPSVELANSSSRLMNMWISHLTSININPIKLHYSIRLSKNVIKKFNIEKIEVIEYWRKNLNIPEEKEIKINWINSKGKPSTYLEVYGTMYTRYHNSLFSLFYNSLINNIKNFIKLNKLFRIGFIRGLIAAEGNINIRKIGSLSLVRIAGSPDKRKFISNILWKYFEINAIDDKKSNQICIGNIKNLRKIKNLDLHILHPCKREQFEKSYKILLDNLNKKHDHNAMLNNKNFISVLRIIAKQPLNYSEIVKSSEVSQKRIDHFLSGYRHGKKYTYNGAIQMGLIRKIKEGRFVIYDLTEKGMQYLDGLNERV